MEDNIANVRPSSGYNDIPLRGTAQMYKDFEKTAVYFDMKNLIEDRIILLQQELEGADTMEEVRDIQGRISELRSMIAYPDYLAQRAEMEKANEIDEENYA